MTPVLDMQTHRELAELRAVRDALLPDRDDATVLSELTVVENRIAALACRLWGARV